MKKRNCQSIQREGKLGTYIGKREGKPNADCQSRSPIQSTSAEPSTSPWGQARPTVASEAGVGRRDRWGQARLVGAGQANGGRKPPGQTRSQHRIDSNGRELTAQLKPASFLTVFTTSSISSALSVLSGWQFETASIIISALAIVVTIIYVVS